MSVLDEAIPADQAEEHLNVMFYGQSGIGKTMFAGSGRDEGKHNLIINIELGITTLKRRGNKTNVIACESYDKFIEIMEACIAEPNRFEWVIIDSITDLQNMIWEKVIQESESRRNGEGSGRKRVPFHREIQDWYEVELRLMDLVHRLCVSECNIIFLAKEQEVLNSEGEDQVVPSIGTKKQTIWAQVAGRCNIVGHISVREVKGSHVRVFNFNYSPNRAAKDQFGIFTKPIANLTLEKFTNKLLEAGDELVAQEESSNPPASNTDTLQKEGK